MIIKILYFCLLSLNIIFTDNNLINIENGKKYFLQKCSSCHKLDERYVGPSLKNVAKRRTKQWILNMILKPSEMLKNDEIAKQLLEEYFINMPYQNVSEKQAEDIFEYLEYMKEK